MHLSRLLLVATIALQACSSSPPSAPAAGAPPRPKAASAAPSPSVEEPATAGASTQPALPPGHPDFGSGPPVVAPPPAGSGTGAAGVAWTKPPSWTEMPPSSGMRRAQYQVPGAAGSAECIVFYFGPGQGGDAASNVERWAGQFVGADGGPAKAQTRKLALEGRSALLVEVTGTYGGGGPMGGAPSESRPGTMLLGAIVEGPDANWFFKLTGPQATVESARADFEEMIRSIRTATSGEAA